MRRGAIWCMALAMTFTLFCGIGIAGEGDSDEKDWYVALRFGYFPYTADIEGTAGSRNFDTSVDLSDILDETETLLGGEIEVGKGRWFIDVAGFFQEVETDRGNVSNGATVTASETAINPMLGYRVFQKGLGGGRVTAVDLMAGAYYVKVDLEANINSTVLGNIVVDRDVDFTDPMGGVRGYYGFTPKFGIGGSGQIGGFGAGSELHYQLTANLIYSATDWLALSAGYKHWFWDYEDDGAFVSDLEQTLSGPVAGVQFKF